MRRACLPATGGIGSARALARLFGHLAAAARGGQSYAADTSTHWPLTTSTIRAASAVHTAAEDVVLGHRVRKGLGYWLGGSDSPQTLPMGDGVTFGHPGSGGSIAWADVSLGVGIAITNNCMTGAAEPPILLVADAARAAAARARADIDKETLV